MTPFEYIKAISEPDAVRRAAASTAQFLGGGTNLVDLMREGVATPATLVDVTGLSGSIATAGGGLLIGAAVTNTAVAENAAVRERYPALSRAILAGASAQIRNMATVAGNILQRTRCAYFCDVEGSRCDKRRPGEGCDAIDGFNRGHAVLGVSADCIATHPSDMAVVLAAYDALVHLSGPEGQRTVPLEGLHLLPGETPDVETVLKPGELITAVELPTTPSGRSAYRKVRDRASYAFALASVAAALDVSEGRVAEARIALGGFAPKPWRARAAEAALVGQPADEAAFARAADIALSGRRPVPATPSNQSSGGAPSSPCSATSREPHNDRTDQAPLRPLARRGPEADPPCGDRRFRRDRYRHGVRRSHHRATRPRRDRRTRDRKATPEGLGVPHPRRNGALMVRGEPKFAAEHAFWSTALSSIQRSRAAPSAPSTRRRRRARPASCL